MLQYTTSTSFNTSSFIGTDVYDKIVAICGKTQMLNDVKKLSPEVQTSHLEAFHSTLNQFHPKMTAYSYTGTYCRLYVVIFNIFLQYTICFFSFSTHGIWEKGGNNRLCAKVWFIYTSISFRHALAIVHFNENIKRDARQTKDGKTYYSIHYPKYKNGDELVRTVAVSPTYQYVADLKNLLFKSSKATLKQKIIAFMNKVPAPPNITVHK